MWFLASSWKSQPLSEFTARFRSFVVHLWTVIEGWTQSQRRSIIPVHRHSGIRFACNVFALIKRTAKCLSSITGLYFPHFAIHFDGMTTENHTRLHAIWSNLPVAIVTRFVIKRCVVNEWIPKVPACAESCSISLTESQLPTRISRFFIRSQIPASLRVRGRCAGVSSQNIQ